MLTRLDRTGEELRAGARNSWPSAVLILDMKKLLLVLAALVGLGCSATPKAEAFVAVSIGVPVVYGPGPYYGYGYGGYYGPPYGYWAGGYWHRHYYRSGYYNRYGYGRRGYARRHYRG